MQFFPNLRPFWHVNLELIRGNFDLRVHFVFWGKFSNLRPYKRTITFNRNEVSPAFPKDKSDNEFMTLNSRFIYLRPYRRTFIGPKRGDPF